ncbi:MAG: SinI family restriction endonuclease [Ruminococcus sp.]|uniref:SinI family restriction endonuclease n=1 Tax=Ruminococcus sp. TaxID=41978 RepID=UPI0025F3BD84|nr:SinI family restriction endonuclease [Ruminococcus sp.]MCR5540669.1 SinI family restriction endonuclease [Ruminococcus sp.]
MEKYTVSNLDSNTIKSAYQQAKNNFTEKNFTDLDLIFKIALNNTSLFPIINLSTSDDPNNPSNYFRRWINNYFNEINKLPSQREAKPKSTCDDPAIERIVKGTHNLSIKKVVFGNYYHNLFMSAENILGNLLEEYIADRIRPYGFIWCAGHVLRAVDFCNTDGSLLLQVKNRSNTENSSSSNIREGTNIEKWYRLSTTKKKGKINPKFQWKELNKLIDENRTEEIMLPPCQMTEDDYENFLDTVAKNNPKLITNQYN